MKFFESQHCKSRLHCKSCRDIDAESFRESLFKEYDDLKEVNFECPFNKPWGASSEPKKKENPKRMTVDAKYIIKNIEKFSYIEGLQKKIDETEKKISEAKCTNCTKNKLYRRISDFALKHMKENDNFEAVKGLPKDTYIIYGNKGHFLKDWMEKK